jgi:hypothetical protein
MTFATPYLILSFLTGLVLGQQWQTLLFMNAATHESSDCFVKSVETSKSLSSLVAFYIK